MKFGAALLMIGGSTAFAPVRFGASRLATTARSFGVDPHFFHDLPQHVDALKDAFSTINLADAVDVADVVPTPDVIPTPDIAAVTAASDTATDTAAAAASSSGNGWFGFLTGPIEGLLQVIHSVLVAVGLSANSWGVSIFFMTVIIKLLTFPLTKTQLESTNKMQVHRTLTRESITYQFQFELTT
jgi:YidC/Oxa1 family membrane protein insertase